MKRFSKNIIPQPKQLYAIKLIFFVGTYNLEVPPIHLLQDKRLRDFKELHVAVPQQGGSFAKTTSATRLGVETQPLT